MGGINDIRNALHSVGVRNATMRYEGEEQVYTLTMDDGRDVEVRTGAGVSTEMVIQAAFSEVLKPKPQPLGTMQGLLGLDKLQELGQQYDAAPEVPTSTPFSSQASGTQTNEETSK